MLRSAGGLFAVSVKRRSVSGSPNVAILLATRNGAAFLDEQLQSLAQQTHPAIDIWASDDGSTDATLDILSALAGEMVQGVVHDRQRPPEGLRRKLPGADLQSGNPGRLFCVLRPGRHLGQPQAGTGDRMDGRRGPGSCRCCSVRGRRPYPARECRSATRPCFAARRLSGTRWCRASPAATRWC